MIEKDADEELEADLELFVTVIATQALTRWYGRRMGIDHIGLGVPEGSLFGFLGPNGAGKTTTIRVLLGFLRPTSGRAKVFGMDSWRDSRRIKEEVGYLPGDLRLYGWMTGAEALGIFGAIRRRDLRWDGRDLAERFRLDLTVKVRKMSRGMRQKLGLILAMAHQPRLLVLDEPTASLDPLMQDELRRQLRDWARAGHTVFFSSHTLSEVEQLCDHVAILREGRMVVSAPLDELRRQSKREVTIRWKSGVGQASEPKQTPGADETALSAETAEQAEIAERNTGESLPVARGRAASSGHGQAPPSTAALAHAIRGSCHGPCDGPAGQAPPAFLEMRERDGRQWRCVLSGEVTDLIRWAAGQPLLEDLAIGHPDLETLFRSYYQQQEGQA